MVFYLIISDFEVDINLLDNRILRVFTYGLTNDNSINERTQMFYSGIEGILNNPFFGDFAGQLSNSRGYWHEERWGAYIHNFISYYRQFGLVAFLLMVFMLTISLCRSVRLRDKSRLMFLGFVFFSLEQIFLRSYNTAYLFTFIGYYSVCIGRYNEK